MPRPTPCRSLNACLWRSRSAITARHVDFVEGREHRRGALRLDEPLGDRRAPLRHADALFGAVAGGRGGASATGAAGRAFGGSAAGLASALARRRGRLRCRRRRRPPAALLDVAPHHAAGVAAALHLARCRRRSARRPCVAVGVARGLGAPRPRAAASRSPRAARLRRLPAAARRRRRRRRHSSSITPSTSPTFTSSPSLRSIRLKHAGLRRADLEVDLVGLELDERIAGRRRRPLPCAATSRRARRRSTHRLRARRCSTGISSPQSESGRSLQSQLKHRSSIASLALALVNCASRRAFFATAAVRVRGARRRTPGRRAPAG